MKLKNRKSLWALIITAEMITATGLTFRSQVVVAEERNIFFLITFLLVAIIYLFDDEFDRVEKTFSTQELQFEKTSYYLNLLKMTTLLFALGFFSSFFFELMGIIAGCSISVLGFLYTVPWVIRKKIIRLKKIFILKNLMIGLGWGLLILMSAESFSSEVLVFTFFVLGQVFIGSSLRDFQDLEEDQAQKVQTLPAVLGPQTSAMILRVINLVLVLVLVVSIKYELIQNKDFLGLMALCVLRFILIEYFQRKTKVGFWLQMLNLCNSGMILLTRF